MLSASLHGQILDCLSVAIRNGLNPTDLWIGPHAASLMQHMFESNQASTTAPVKLEGSRYMDLVIRLMQSEGVRVGTTY